MSRNPSYRNWEQQKDPLAANQTNEAQREKQQQKEKEVTHSNELVGVVHHGYEHVQQHNQGDDVVGPKHGGPNKLCELVPGFDVGDVEVQQPKHRPEE